VSFQLVRLKKSDNTINASTQFQSDLDIFNKLYDFVETNYVKGKPRYISDPKTSHIRIISYVQYKALSVKEVQTMLRDRHIVITDFPVEEIIPTDGPVAFDEAGLQVLRNLEAPIKFQGKVGPILLLAELIR
jgi:hypothetical protein